MDLAQTTLCYALLIRRSIQRWLDSEVYPEVQASVAELPAEDPNAPLCRGTPCGGAHPHTGARAVPGSDPPLCAPCQNRPRTDHVRLAFRLALDRAPLARSRWVKGP